MFHFIHSSLARLSPQEPLRPDAPGVKAARRELTNVIVAGRLLHQRGRFAGLVSAAGPLEPQFPSAAERAIELDQATGGATNIIIQPDLLLHLILLHHVDTVKVG